MFRSQRLDVPFASKSVFFFWRRIPEKFSENRIVGLLSIIVELPSYLADFAVLETLAPHHQKGGKYYILQIFRVPKPDN